MSRFDFHMMDERTRRVALAALAGVIQRGVTTLAAFLMFPRVLHALGTDRFGVWGGVTSLIQVITIADFGVGAAIVTLVARAVVLQERDSPREYFTAALVMGSGIAAMFATVFAAIIMLCAPKPLVTVYLIAVAGMAINVPLGTANSAWLALQRGWMLGLSDLVQSAFLIGGLALAIRYSTDIHVYVLCVYGALAGASAINMTYLLFSHPELRPVHWRVPVARARTVLSIGSRYFVLAVLDAFSYLLDNVVALQLLGAAASAKMAIAQKACIAALGLLLVVVQPLWPAFVDAAARRDQRWIFQALARGSLLVTAAAVAGSALIVMFGKPLLKLWLKTSIGIDQTLLWVMAFWIVSLSLVRVQTFLLNALGIIRFQIVLFSIATVIAFSLKLLLAPLYGVAGILMATAVTFPVIVLPAVLWRINRWRRLNAE